MEKKIIPISPTTWAGKKDITRQMACYLLRKHEVKGTIPEGVEKIERIGSRWIIYVDKQCG
jgi:hypothetical protein